MLVSFFLLGSLRGRLWHFRSCQPLSCIHKLLSGLETSLTGQFLIANVSFFQQSFSDHFVPGSNHLYQDSVSPAKWIHWLSALDGPCTQKYSLPFWTLDFYTCWFALFLHKVQCTSPSQWSSSSSACTNRRSFTTPNPTWWKENQANIWASFLLEGEVHSERLFFH